MRIRITHDAGVADLPKGAVVDLDDRRAERLIHDGYAVLDTKGLIPIGGDLMRRKAKEK
jgi:hypothetical protein